LSVHEHADRRPGRAEPAGCGETLIQEHAGTKTHRPVGLDRSRGDDQQLRPLLRGVCLPSLEVFEHPLAEAAVGIPEQDEDREAVDPLAPIASEHNVAVLVVHHLREMESDDPLDMITGSVGLTSGVDGALVLKRQRGNANAFLHVDGRDIEEQKELALLWDAASAKWTETGEAEEHRRSETRQNILKALEEAEEPLGPKKVAERTGLDVDVVRQRLHHMSKAGEVMQVARGLYAPHNDRNIRNGHQKDVTDVMDVMGSIEKDSAA
jgi:hypothetical protein